eukprot:CAMPEP_0119153372 /NCGR_PEP_ID=MMETSP1310-20130426/49165_1 /TAXON_ID=464262 /ORGANISM="Genus nov. species nov., Strain RCC2339" /LENGTH=55 /DNA_ID=CAMNT_0007145823 /DNA_START=40 /DNA_END=204 /DNA_ORIENTATION=-
MARGQQRENGGPPSSSSSSSSSSESEEEAEMRERYQYATEVEGGRSELAWGKNGV